MLLTEGKWTDAEGYFNRVLELEPENAEAYLGLAMADMEIPDQDSFVDTYIYGWIDIENKNLNRVRRFAKGELKEWLEKLETKRQEHQAEQQRLAEEKAEAERKRKEAEAERQRQEADAKARAEAEIQKKIAALEAEKASIRAELPNIKGLFSGGKRRELEDRLVKIGEELKKLREELKKLKEELSVAVDETAVRSPMPANIYKVECSVGQFVNAGDVLVVLEAMKMEIEVVAPVAGTVRAVTAVVGATVNTDALLVVLTGKTAAAVAPALAPVPAAGETAVKSSMPANIYKVECSVGQFVNAGDVLVVLEALGMEIEVSAPVAGAVKAVTAVVGTAVNTDDLLVILS